MKPYLGTHNTLDRLNNLSLSLELAARGVYCEMPSCSNFAMYLVPQGWTVFLCYHHWMVMQQNPDRIFNSISAFQKVCSEQILEAALAGEHQLIQYNPA